MVCGWDRRLIDFFLSSSKTPSAPPPQKKTPQGGDAVSLLAPQQDLAVPEGFEYVVGDNAEVSIDSRVWGVVPQGTFFFACHIVCMNVYLFCGCGLAHTGLILYTRVGSLCASPYTKYRLVL